MISLMLLALAVGWVVLLRTVPWLFARKRPQATVPRYHYDACGTEELPTWKRKRVQTDEKSPRW
jgi:hypothetical protein